MHRHWLYKHLKNLGRLTPSSVSKPSTHPLEPQKHWLNTHRIMSLSPAVRKDECGITLKFLDDSLDLSIILAGFDQIISQWRTVSMAVLPRSFFLMKSQTLLRAKQVSTCCLRAPGLLHQASRNSGCMPCVFPLSPLLCSEFFSIDKDVGSLFLRDSECKKSLPAKLKEMY